MKYRLHGLIHIFLIFIGIRQAVRPVQAARRRIPQTQLNPRQRLPCRGFNEFRSVSFVLLSCHLFCLGLFCFSGPTQLPAALSLLSTFRYQICGDAFNDFFVIFFVILKVLLKRCSLFFVSDSCLLCYECRMLSTSACTFLSDRFSYWVSFCCSKYYSYPIISKIPIPLAYSYLFCMIHLSAFS